MIPGGHTPAVQATADEIFPAPITYLRDAEMIAQGLADHRRLGWVCRRMASTLRSLYDLEPALAYCQRTHAAATALGDRALQVWVNLDRGQVAFELGDYRQAMEYLQQMLTALHGEWRYQALGGAALPTVHACVWMVRCLGQVGKFTAGVAYGAEALQIAEAVDRPYERLAVYSRVGALHVYQGTLHTAVPLRSKGQ